MTVGDLFLIIILIIIVWFSLAHILYRIEVKRLTKLGYKNPRQDANFPHYVVVSFFSLSMVGMLITVLYQVTTNWNTPICIIL